MLLKDKTVGFFCMLCLSLTCFMGNYLEILMEQNRPGASLVTIMRSEMDQTIYNQ